MEWKLTTRGGCGSGMIWWLWRCGGGRGKKFWDSSLRLRLVDVLFRLEPLVVAVLADETVLPPLDIDPFLNHLVALCQRHYPLLSIHTPASLLHSRTLLALRTLRLGKEVEDACKRILA